MTEATVLYAVLACLVTGVVGYALKGYLMGQPPGAVDAEMHKLAEKVAEWVQDDTADNKVISAANARKAARAALKARLAQ
jgi:hypothetical protein